jgi:hypothetical protein
MFAGVVQSFGGVLLEIVDSLGVHGE